MEEQCYLCEEETALVASSLEEVNERAGIRLSCLRVQNGR